MKIRPATSEDLIAVNKTYDEVHDAEDAGSLVVGWARDVYPTRQMATNALSRGDLFVMVDSGHRVASAIINHQQVDVYRGAHWRYQTKNDAVMVLHTLTVSPRYKGHRAGTQFVHFYENYGRQHHCSKLRIDTQAKNRGARNFYHHLGFTEVDVKPCVFNGISNVQLVLLEKHFK